MTVCTRLATNKLTPTLHCLDLGVGFYDFVRARCSTAGPIMSSARSTDGKQARARVCVCLCVRVCMCVYLCSRVCVVTKRSVLYYNRGYINANFFCNIHCQHALQVSLPILFILYKKFYQHSWLVRLMQSRAKARDDIHIYLMLRHIHFKCVKHPFLPFLLS